jgi:hypothetical protein
MTTPQTKSVRSTPERAAASERTSGALQVPVRTQPEVLLDLTSSDVPEQLSSTSPLPSSVIGETFTDPSSELSEGDQSAHAFASTVAARSLVHLVDAPPEPPSRIKDGPIKKLSW